MRPVPPGPAVAVDAPAKLTLSLRITGTRPDGYHLIDAEMVSLDLADRLEFRTGTGVSVVGVDGTPVDTVPTGPDNLVSQALRLSGRQAHVTVHKRIPPGGGLGGGSTDAAAVLRWAGFRDLAAAAGIGADVPYCMVGGRARVRGIGELVDPLPVAPRTFTLLMPPVVCSTPAVYAAWDDLGGPAGSGVNDLEPAALRAFPDLARWRDLLGELTGITPVLAGSGSTWFVPGSFPFTDLSDPRLGGARLRVVSTVGPPV